MSHEQLNKRLLIIATFGMVIAFTVWNAFSPIINEIGKMYHLNTTEKSVLIAIPVLLGSVMRVPLGIITERYGGRKVYTLLLLFLVIPLIITGFSSSYIMLLISAFFIGLAGASFAVSMTFVSKWTPKEKQGTALGINALGNIGTAVASFSLPSLVLIVGIQWIFWGLIIPVLIMAAIIWFFTPETTNINSTKTVKSELSVLKYKQTWILSLFYFVTFGIFVAFGIYLPTLLMDLFHLSAIDAGMKAAGFIVIATFIRPFGGYFSDKLNAGKILTGVFLVIICCGLLLTLAVENFYIMTFASLLLAFAVGIGNGAVFKLVPNLFPTSTGTVTGIVGAAGGIGGFFPPIMLGVIKEHTGGYSLGFVLLIMLTFICLWFNKREYDNRMKTKKVKSIHIAK
jgi:MFS transporter, NNP family, nitrate/nitrite transporter